MLARGRFVGRAGKTAITAITVPTSMPSTMPTTRPTTMPTTMPPTTIGRVTATMPPMPAMNPMPVVLQPLPLSRI
eukprot:1340366-Amorphochlora_amoeboformis.AAC.1